MPIHRMFLAIFALLLLPTGNAHAYIDPGTGSFIVQMLIASILGAVFTVKLWIGSIKNFFVRLVGGGHKSETDREPSPISDQGNLTTHKESSNA
ncbi:MAG: hypothetical protein VYA34_14855 [Myxococcota bacterium]|nr:hypothetical protein [Myxococcota bacterium]